MQMKYNSDIANNDIKNIKVRLDGEESIRKKKADMALAEIDTANKIAIIKLDAEEKLIQAKVSLGRMSETTAARLTAELAEAIVGLQEHVHGTISLDGVDITKSSVRDALHSGIAFVPESREEDGLIASFSIEENLILDLHDLPPYAKGPVISPSIVSQEAQKRVAEFDIRAQSAKDPASSLSGGNKQKVVLARELSRPVKLVVASQPTRGLDVGSIEFVHERIIAERDSGRAVLLFSTELDEVSALADRIAVMYRGEFIAIVPATTSREDLGLLMAGVKP